MYRTYYVFFPLFKRERMEWWIDCKKGNLETSIGRNLNLFYFLFISLSSLFLCYVPFFRQKCVKFVGGDFSNRDMHFSHLNRQTSFLHGLPKTRVFSNFYLWLVKAIGLRQAVSTSKNLVTKFLQVKNTNILNFGKKVIYPHEQYKIQFFFTGSI